MRLSAIFKSISNVHTQITRSALAGGSTGRVFARFLSKSFLPPGVREITPEMAERLLREIPLEPGEVDEEDDKRYRRPATKIRTHPTAKSLSQAVSIETVLGAQRPSVEIQTGTEKSHSTNKRPRANSPELHSTEESEVVLVNSHGARTASLEELESALEDVCKTEELTSEILDNMKGIHRYRRQGEILVKEANDMSESANSNDEFFEEEIEDDEESFDELEDFTIPEDPQRVAQTVGGEGIYSFELREEDLMEQFIRGSGPGGQAVNKTKNCVYLRHVPTGTVVKCQQTRSLTDNRHIARKIMKLKLQAIHLGPNSKQAQRAAKIRKRKQRSKRRHAKKNSSLAESQALVSTEHSGADFVEAFDSKSKDWGQNETMSR